MVQEMTTFHIMVNDELRKLIEQRKAIENTIKKLIAERKEIEHALKFSKWR